MMAGRQAGRQAATHMDDETTRICVICAWCGVCVVLYCVMLRA